MYVRTYVCICRLGSHIVRRRQSFERRMEPVLRAPHQLGGPLLRGRQGPIWLQSRTTTNPSTRGAEGAELCVVLRDASFVDESQSRPIAVEHLLHGGQYGTAGHLLTLAGSQHGRRVGRRPVGRMLVEVLLGSAGSGGRDGHSSGGGDRPGTSSPIVALPAGYQIGFVGHWVA